MDGLRTQGHNIGHETRPGSHAAASLTITNSTASATATGSGVTTDETSIFQLLVRLCLQPPDPLALGILLSIRRTRPSFLDRRACIFGMFDFLLVLRRKRPKSVALLHL
ncbi:unnamed protein product [Protopolystoma xenopodis]|uniref:Uncharacterized protein n=1 Tax=Protopolystoma xenopodis TaxID=117903 RepID=A0A3S5CIN7_9PLAT|nr:unnamed protein product [Protopolystoma xenopodis]